MATATVSICLPNLNTRQFLPERMESILGQTLADWELIVCDSYSDDGSWEFFQKFKGDARVHLYQVPRAGIYAGWNECLRRARGNYIYIATSDDTARPNLLEKLVAPLETNPELSISLCDFQEIDEASKPLPARYHYYTDFFGEWLEVPCLRSGQTEFLLHASLGNVWITMASVLCRRSLLDRVGLYRMDCGSFADFDWALRACLLSDIRFVPGKLTTFRRYAEQATPMRFDRRHYRALLRLLDRVLHAENSGIPPQWKRLANWDTLILQTRRQVYCNTYRLNRWDAKRDFRGFARDFWDALTNDRRTLWRYAASGFARDREELPDSASLTRNLIAYFGAPWPPQPIAANS